MGLRYIVVMHNKRICNDVCNGHVMMYVSFLIVQSFNCELFILVGWGRSFLSVAWPTGVQLMFFFSSGVSKLFGAQGSPSLGSLLNL